MKFKFKLLSAVLVLCILLGVTIVLAVDNPIEVDNYENNSINNLFDDMMNNNGTFNMEKDYEYHNNDSVLIVGGGDLIINGNGHKIDGLNNISGLLLDNNGSEGRIVVNNLTIENVNGSALSSTSCELVVNNLTIVNNDDNEDAILSIIESDNVTLNNVIVKDNVGKGEAVINILESNNVTLNNVVIEDNVGNGDCIAHLAMCGNITLSNCSFQSNSNASSLVEEYSNVTINNSSFLDKNDSSSDIIQNRGSLKIENCSFDGRNSDYGGILNFKGDFLSVRNSNFSNSGASLTGGAIVAKYFPKIIGNESVPSDAMIIENCSFTDLSSKSNGGAVYMDLDSGSNGIPQTLNVVNSSFTNCNSKFGGAIVNTGGTLNISNSKFINNSAESSGGAIYTSWADLNIDDSIVSNNSAESNASAIYFDKGTFIIDNSNLSGNGVSSNGTVIYANDAKNRFNNSVFDNNGTIYGNFANNSKIENINSTDMFSFNNKDYITSVENKAIKLNLKNDSEPVGQLPSKFDSRDKGWASPLKFQGDNLACWAFATAGSMECSLLKSTGVFYNLSENNIQDLQLRYYKDGDTRNNVTGFAYSGLGYALSWYGPVSAQDDPYDERGMISEVEQSDNRIHLQDARIIFGGQNDTISSIKESIMKYGSVSVQFNVTTFKYNYDDGVHQPTHFVPLIGWDDSIPAEKFNDSEINKVPPKPGGWIIKDSEGLNVGDDGYDYLSYCDKSFLANDYYAVVPQAAAIAYIFENDVDYHVNYQTDLIGLAGFDGNYTQYSNEFVSKYNESIGAVGTYFNDSGIDYSFDVYVNGNLAHSQNGSSEFAGFKTIKLDKNISVKSNDTFKVVFKSNAVPYQAFSRQHYVPGMSFVSENGDSWKDITLDDKTVCLKVYTVANET